MKLISDKDVCDDHLKSSHQDIEEVTSGKSINYSSVFIMLVYSLNFKDVRRPQASHQEKEGTGRGIQLDHSSYFHF